MQLLLFYLEETYHNFRHMFLSNLKSFIWYKIWCKFFLSNVAYFAVLCWCRLEICYICDFFWLWFSARKQKGWFSEHSVHYTVRTTWMIEKKLKNWRNCLKKSFHWGPRSPKSFWLLYAKVYYRPTVPYVAKIMRMSTVEGRTMKITISGQNLERVKQFCYLGSIQTI